jgi:hypothetical protein
MSRFRKFLGFSRITLRSSRLAAMRLPTIPHGQFEIHTHTETNPKEASAQNASEDFVTLSPA